MFGRLAQFITTSLVMTACSTTASSHAVRLAGSTDFETTTESGEPNLYVTPTGEAFLSWLSRTDSGNALMIAARHNGTWGDPVVAYESNAMFANWADFPSMAVASDGRWIVHWLEKTEDAPYAYHARLSHSKDRGMTWSDPLTVHTDQSPSEHGFVSMLPAANGTIDLIWLDGRETVNEPRGAMQVRYGLLNEAGQMTSEEPVDIRVCDCCQTALARSDRGLVAAYRDRSDEEIRDIAIKVRDASGWSAPVHVGEDAWEITGCPVNGPSLATRGNLVAVAWFAAPESDDRVQIAFSRDGGETFGPPVRIDRGSPLGRVDVEFIGDETAYVVWLERQGEEAEIMGVTVGVDGSRGDVTTLIPTSQARASGFPRIARSGDQLLIAHRVLASEGNYVRVLTADIDN